jgi:hypothetical protein
VESWLAELQEAEPGWSWHRAGGAVHPVMPGTKPLPCKRIGLVAAEPGCPGCLGGEPGLLGTGGWQVRLGVKESVFLLWRGQP